MQAGINPSVFLTWKCPCRATGKRELTHIPIDIFDEIFSWLRPAVDFDTNAELYRRTLARLAPVCRYFMYYAIRESARSLEFDGHPEKRLYKPCTPTGKWCSGIIRRQEPMETFRSEIRECTICDWIPTRDEACDWQWMPSAFTKFLDLFPRMVERLDNLVTLQLWKTPISLELFKKMGRLGKLQNLDIRGCSFEIGNAPTFSSKPFLALCRLSITESFTDATSSTTDIFSAIASAPALQSLTLADFWWFPIMYPHLSRGLRSLSLNVSREDVGDLVTYLKESNALEYLTVYSQPGSGYISAKDGSSTHRFQRRLVPNDAAHFKFDQSSLGLLRTFRGPAWLALMLVPGRSVSRVVLGCQVPVHHLNLDRPVLHDMRALVPRCQTALTFSDDGFYEGIDGSLKYLSKVEGEGIQGLSLYLPAAVELSLVALHLPKLVHLQLQAIGWYHLEAQEEFLSTFESDLHKFRCLDALILCERLGGRLIYRLSPGHQYEFVDAWKAACPTLNTVVFGPYMVWHWRRSALESVKNTANPSSYLAHHQWELEILSPRLLREALRKQAQEELPEHVLDWRDKLKDIFEEPLGIGEDVLRIFLP